MTPTECEIIKRLNHCQFLPGTPEKRFIRDINRLAEHDPDHDLTAKQIQWLGALYWKYRKQLTARGYSVLSDEGHPYFERVNKCFPIYRIARTTTADGYPSFGANYEPTCSHCLVIFAIDFAIYQAAGVPEVSEAQFYADYDRGVHRQTHRQRMQEVHQQLSLFQEAA